MNEVLTTRAPHLRSPGVEQSTHAALMIDFDNVTIGIRSNLGQEIRKLLSSDVIRGKVSIQRAYADWRRYPQYIVPLSEASVDLIFAPAYGSSKKNATDIRLAIDAVEIVFTRPEIGTFILLSGDSDFSSLVLKLKEYGKYVIGVGMKESSSELLVQNCDEYYSYTSLSGLVAASDVKTETFDPWVLAGRTIQRMVERKDVMRSDRFKQVMLEFDSSFSERSLGFSKFNRFLSEAASRGIITLEKGANGQYEVATGSRADEMAKRSHSVPEPTVQSRSTSRSSSSSRSRGSSRGRRGGSRRSSSAEIREAPPSDQPAPEVDEDRLRTAYSLLRDVVGDLATGNEAVRDSEIKRQMLRRDPKFDEAALGFRKYSRFLRQAHDEGIINLEQGAEGNYLVSPIADEAGAMTSEADTAQPVEPNERSRGRSSRRGGRGLSRADSDRDSGVVAAESETPSTEAEIAAAEPETPSTEAEITAAEPEAAATETVATEPAVSTTKPQEPVIEATPPKDKPRPGLGRFRSGSRGRSTRKPSAAPTASSVAVTPTDSMPAGQKEKVEETKPEVGTQSTSPSKGQARSRTRSVRGTSPDSKTAAKYGSEIERMSKAYPSVGRRTAERLFEEFGDELLTVIDNQPERIKAILPEHRAQAVIDGRKAERESNDAS
ncbi:MAG: NYN domain-containing protein [Gemmatimonadota bacterium]